jgi:RNA polymerase sigma-70 factor (ECF subfamily)
MSEVDDLLLLERMRRGDEDAFAAIYAAHHPPIYRYALQMCGAAAADDVVQETFMALLRQPNRYEADRGPFVNYLFGIARHHVIKRIASSPSEVSIDEDGAAAEGAFSMPALTPLEDLSRAETVDAVRAAIRSLPAPYREVVVLCDLEELDYAAAAALIACPLGTVRSRLHRARALLASKLASMQPMAAGGHKG